MSFLERIINVEQGSPEWKAARAGRVTASRIKDVLATIKSGEAASRRNYRVQVVGETLTGLPQESVVYTKDMQWGNEQEPFARAEYMVAEGVVVDQVGMVIHPASDRCACSPDGLVNWDGKNAPEGLIQIKCPLTATHLEYCDSIESGIVPADYQPQMLWEMACTGAAWCDFVTFDPRLPDYLQLGIIRFYRDEARIKAIEAEVERFLSEVDAMVNRLQKRKEVAA